ncbi:MAG TPA: OmpA family protein [Candidatus Eisenbacteria bacterium]|nr:OmpA family protein [Candidatus Eisenbacteria bacterium]
MSRFSVRLVVVAAVLFASPAFAQITGRPIEVSGQLGWSAPDARAHVKSGLAFGGSVGMRMLPWLVLEGQAYMAPSEADTFPEPSHDFTSLGLDVRINVRPGDSRVVPYLIYGLAALKSSTTGTPPDDLTRGTPSLGAGALINLRNQRSYLRIQIRDSFFRQRDAKESDNDFVVTAGLHWLFGGKEKDTDLDSVREWLDACPGTPIGAKVNAQGCSIDADRDSVADGLDQCVNTPPGCKVDAKGCPTDADGDGVCDGVDTCPDTPQGTSVDEKGCPNDTDADGVKTPTDQCPDTPKGAIVDEKGCPRDADSDGVFDGLDQCPETATGMKVNAQGCPTEVLEKEKELFDTGMIRLQNVSFATGKAELLSASFGVLDVVGQVLRRWPELKIEIGAHTDNRGADRENQRLSEARARSVLDYLVQKYPDVGRARFTPKGYGESRPLVPNTSEANMTRNRRVEFVVTNRDQLRRDAQKRREQQQSAPETPR